MRFRMQSNDIGNCLSVMHMQFFDDRTWLRFLTC